MSFVHINDVAKHIIVIIITWTEDYSNLFDLDYIYEYLSVNHATAGSPMKTSPEPELRSVTPSPTKSNMAAIPPQSLPLDRIHTQSESLSSPADSVGEGGPVFSEHGDSDKSKFNLGNLLGGSSVQSSGRFRGGAPLTPRGM